MTDKDIHYGFTSDGGFAAVCHVRQIGVYAYESSPYEREAHKDPEATANEMINGSWLIFTTKDHREEHYNRTKAMLLTATCPED